MLTMNEKDKNEIAGSHFSNENEATSASYGRSSWPGLIPMH